jgi:hypothetical protein
VTPDITGEKLGKFLVLYSDAGNIHTEIFSEVGKLGFV